MTLHVYRIDNSQQYRRLDGLDCHMIRELGDEDRDAEVGPMFEVQFESGERIHAFAYELDPEPRSDLLVFDDSDPSAPYWRTK